MLNQEKLTYSVREAAEALGLSERTLRTRIKERLIPHVRMRRRILIPRTALEDYLAKEAACSVRPNPAGSPSRSAASAGGRDAGILPAVQDQSLLSEKRRATGTHD